MGRAVSDDGIHFTKLQPNPFAVPPHGYNPLHFRDPIVFADAGGDGYHMLVTSMRDDWPLAGRGGCLAHLHSPDLQDWQMREPFLVPGFDDAPECPDYFCLERLVLPAVQQPPDDTLSHVALRRWGRGCARRSMCWTAPWRA